MKDDFIEEMENMQTLSKVFAIYNKKLVYESII